MRYLKTLFVGFWAVVTIWFSVSLIGIPVYELVHTGYGKGNALGQLFASGLITLIGLFVLYLIGAGIYAVFGLEK